MHNKDQATHDKDQITKDAIKEEVRAVLAGAKYPLTVANIVKATGHHAEDVREALFDMVAVGEAQHRAWMYTL